MTATDLRPRTAVEIIDASFRLMRRNYIEMATAAGAIVIPAAMVELLLPLPPDTSPLSSLFSLVAAGAVIHIASRGYLGEEVSVTESLRQAFSRMLPLIAASIIQVTLIVIGLVLLIVPGLVLSAWLFAMPAAVMLERTGPLEAISRSHELASGSVLRIIGILVLAFIIYVFLVIGLGAFAAVPMMFDLIGLGAAGFLGNVLGVLALPIWSSIITLLYYDMRIRKEAFDLHVMAGNLAKVPTPSHP